MMGPEEKILAQRHIDALRGIEAAIRLLAGVVLDIKMLMIASATKPAPRGKAKGK